MTKLNKAETKTEFAARVSLTKSRVSQLVAEGLPVRDDGMIDVEAGLAWMEKNLDPSRRGKGGAINTGFGSPSVADVRRMLMLVQVQRARLAYDKERASLIDASAATATIFARARAERDAHMAWVQRAAPLVAGRFRGLDRGDSALVEQLRAAFRPGRQPASVVAACSE